jgi:hypothetical protein
VHVVEYGRDGAAGARSLLAHFAKSPGRLGAHVAICVLLQKSDQFGQYVRGLSADVAQDFGSLGPKGPVPSRCHWEAKCAHQGGTASVMASGVPCQPAVLYLASPLTDFCRTAGSSWDNPPRYSLNSCKLIFTGSPSRRFHRTDRFRKCRWLAQIQEKSQIYVPIVDPTDARNTENQIGIDVSGRKSLRARGSGRTTLSS